MTHTYLRRGMLLAALAATLALPSETQACWFTSCFGHSATYAPAPAPTYGYAPACPMPTYASYAPVTASYAPVTACYSPCSTCNTCNSCNTCNTCGYAPTTSYMPVTTYQAVTAYSPVSGGGCCLCPWSGGTTGYKQVTSYVPTTSYMPVTSYTPTCTTNYCNTCNYCNSCSTGCSTCGSGCSSCGTGCSSCGTGCSSCGTGCSSCGTGCSSCGTTVSASYAPATTTTIQSAPAYQAAPAYAPATVAPSSGPGCSSCNASTSAPAPAYAAGPTTTYASSPANTTFSSGPATTTQMPLIPLNNSVPQGAQKTTPDAKTDNGTSVNKQMSDPAPRLVDPRDRTASMPIMRTWTGAVQTQTVSEVRQAAAQVPADDTDADGWHAPRGR